MRHAPISLALICLSAGCATRGSPGAPASTSPTAAAAPAQRAAPAEERHWQELPRFKSVQVALLYSYLSRTDPPYDDLAWFYESVSQAPDEATRRGAIARARTKLAREDAQLRQRRNFVITSPEATSMPYEYDPGRKGWTTAFRRLGGFTYALPHSRLVYAVRFENADRVEFIPMRGEPGGEAGALPPREVDLDIECEPIGTRSVAARPAGAEPGGGAAGAPEQRQVLARIVRVRVRPHDADGPVYADVAIAGR